MGRPSIGGRIVMNLVRNVAGITEGDGRWRTIKHPLVALVKAAPLHITGGITENTLRRYLLALETLGYIEFAIGGPNGRAYESLNILKDSIPNDEEVAALMKQKGGRREGGGAAVKGAQASAAVAAPHYAPQKAARVPTASVEAPPERKERTPSRWLLLVDWENTVYAGQDNGFTVSFARLKEYVRGMGNIIVADAFVSPYAAREERVVQGLWDAGFQVIACPMRHKDVDAVDTKMIARARQYLAEMPNINICIVSRDNDFSDLKDFADDMHRTVILLNVVEFKKQLAGEDEVTELSEGRERKSLERAYAALVNGQLGNITPDIEHRKEFLKAVIRIVERHCKEQMAFNVLHGTVEQHMRRSTRWKGDLRIIRTALTTLVDHHVFWRSSGDGSVAVYRLNKEDTVVLMALAVDPKKSAFGTGGEE